MDAQEQLAAQLKNNIIASIDIPESRTIKIISQTYIDEHLDYSFEEINNSTWNATFKFTEPFYSDLKKCLSQILNMTCWNNLKTIYLPNSSSTQLKTDLLNFTNYPLRNLTSGISFSNFSYNAISGEGRFNIIFPNGFQDGLRATLGFGSTSITTSTAVNNIIPISGRAICRTTNRVHMAWRGSGNVVEYKNFTDNSSITGGILRQDGSGNGDNIISDTGPSLACKGNSVFIAWATSVSIVYRNSTDEGATWSPDVGTVAPIWADAPLMPNSFAPSVSFGRSDNVFIIYNNDQGNTERLNITNSSSYNDNYPSITSTNITNDINFGETDMWFDYRMNETGYVLYRNSLNNDLFLNRTSDGGGTWSGYLVSAGTYNEPSLLWYNDTLLLASTYDSANDIQIFNSTTNGSTWNSANRLDTIGAGTSQAQRVSLATNYTDIWAFWQQNDTSSTNRNWQGAYRHWNEANGWDGSVTIWQNTTASGVQRNMNFNAKINASSGLIEVMFTNGTSTTANIFYDFINVTVSGAGADTTLPQFSTNSTNNTFAGNGTNFTITATDDTGLSGFYFETNNTGTRINSSFTILSGTAGTAWNFTVLNSTQGTLIQYRAYANDTSNNWNTSETYNLTTNVNLTAVAVFRHQINQSISILEQRGGRLTIIRQPPNPISLVATMNRILGLFRTFQQPLDLEESIRRLKLLSGTAIFQGISFTADVNGTNIGASGAQTLTRTASQLIAFTDSIIRTRIVLTANQIVIRFTDLISTFLTSFRGGGVPLFGQFFYFQPPNITVNNTIAVSPVKILMRGVVGDSFERNVTIWNLKNNDISIYINNSKGYDGWIFPSETVFDIKPNSNKTVKINYIIPPFTKDGLYRFNTSVNIYYPIRVTANIETEIIVGLDGVLKYATEKMALSMVQNPLMILLQISVMGLYLYYRRLKKEFAPVFLGIFLVSLVIYLPL